MNQKEKLTEDETKYFDPVVLKESENFQLMEKKKYKENTLLMIYIKPKNKLKFAGNIYVRSKL